MKKINTLLSLMIIFFILNRLQLQSAARQSRVASGMIIITKILPLTKQNKYIITEI